MIDVKRFSGVMNHDDLPENVLAPQHIDAMNLRFYGGQNGLTAENIRGNYSINNNDLPSGKNQCIGTFFDSVNQIIIWFNWNENGNHGIYKLDIQSESVSTIFLCGTDSLTDILNFNPNYPIHSCSIVYRTSGDGDLIYWTDGYNRPKYLNIATVSSLAPFNAEMLYAAKISPNTPPLVSYTSDAALGINNVDNKIFRFAYRYVFENLEKSTISPTSEVPIPLTGFSPTVNNAISIGLFIGYPDLTKGDIKDVEILGQECIGSNVYSDYFLIESINKNEFPVGNFLTYNFINDSAYPFIALNETDLRFSYLPDKANTLEVLNGNVIIYGGITDGYDQFSKSDIDVLIYSNLYSGLGFPSLASKLLDNKNFNLIIGSDSGIVANGKTVTINFKYTNGIIYTISYTYTFSGNQSITTAATNLALSLNGNFSSLGISSEVSATASGNIILITTSNNAGVFYDLNNTSDAGSNLSILKSIPWDSRYRWGLMYFDEFGKTNGVVSYVDSDITKSFDYKSMEYVQQKIPFMMASINHAPPSWAKTFKWVRTQNKSFNQYIQLVTNELQSDTGHFYFCIENLYYLKEQSAAFIPGYEFTEGDRLKVIGSFNNSTGVITPFANQVDYEILGIEQRNMSTPSATPGAFVKVEKPVSPPAYAGNYFFIQLYTPSLQNGEKTELFYEFGKAFDIYTLGGVRYHRGNQTDQTASLPATFLFSDGGSYYHSRQFYLNVGDTNTIGALAYPYQIMSPSLSDFYNSTVNSDSRGWPIDPNAKEEYNSALVRWGGKYQSGTNVNQLNIFQAEDFDEVDRGKGDIRRFKARDRILRVFQDRGTGQYGVYARYIQNNQGQSELVTTNDIITTNNIQYYLGNYGISKYPTNLVSSTTDDYFADVVTGRCVRLGRDGLSDLGLLYKGQYYLSNLVTVYNNSLERNDGYRSKVMGFFDFFENQYHCVLEGGHSAGALCEFYNINQGANYIFAVGGVGGGAINAGDVVNVTLSDTLGNTELFSYTVQSSDDTESIQLALIALINASVNFTATYQSDPLIQYSWANCQSVSGNIVGNIEIEYNSNILTADAQNFSFNESRNGFCSFYSYHPEWSLGANNMVYTWLNGILYKHDNITDYCKFYGVQEDAYLTIVFNPNIHTKKSWNSLMEIANTIWHVPFMQTNTYSYGTTKQQSSLNESEFTLLEANPSAAIKRDANSTGGKLNGGYMKGNYLVAKFQKTNANNLVNLSEVSVRYIDSPLTVR